MALLVWRAALRGEVLARFFVLDTVTKNKTKIYSFRTIVLKLFGIQGGRGNKKTLQENFPEGFSAFKVGVVIKTPFRKIFPKGVRKKPLPYLF